MSIMGLVDPSRADVGNQGIEAPSTTFGDVFSSALPAVARNQLTNSKGLFTDEERWSRDRKYKEVSGRNLLDDAVDASPEKDKLKSRMNMADNSALMTLPEYKKAVDDYLNQVKSQHPDKYADVLNSQGIDDVVKQKANSAAEAQAKASAGATGLASFAGNLGGGLVASLADPINLAGLALGAGEAATIFKTAMIEAGINAGSEAVSYPFVKQWQNELGKDYGPADLVENMGMAALFGAGLGGGGKAISVGLEKMHLANSVKLAKMREALEIQEREHMAGNIKEQTFKSAQPVNEVVQALRHEERRIHLDEADPARYGSNQEIADAHAKALTEVDAAINESRPVNLEMKDDVIRNMDPELMDDSTKAVHKEIVAKSKEPVYEAKGEKPNEIFNEQKAVSPTLERQQELLDHYESPEYKVQEQIDFAKAFPDPGAHIHLDDGTTVQVKHLREEFKSDKDFISAISSCGLAALKVTA